jgi:hypothetical protein
MLCCTTEALITPTIYKNTLHIRTDNSCRVAAKGHVHLCTCSPATPVLLPPTMEQISGVLSMPMMHVLSGLPSSVAPPCPCGAAGTTATARRPARASHFAQLSNYSFLAHPPLEANTDIRGRTTETGSQWAMATTVLGVSGSGEGRVESSGVWCLIDGRQGFVSVARREKVGFTCSARCVVGAGSE